MRPAGAPQTHLGEEPPPLPVAQLEVGGAVPLQDLHGRQLLLPLGEGPVGRGSRSLPPGSGRPISLPTVLTLLPGALLEGPTPAGSTSKQMWGGGGRLGVESYR